MNASIVQLPQVAPADCVGAQGLVGREDLRERWECSEPLVTYAALIQL